MHSKLGQAESSLLLGSGSAGLSQLCYSLWQLLRLCNARHKSAFVSGQLHLAQAMKRNIRSNRVQKFSSVIGCIGADQPYEPHEDWQQWASNLQWPVRS